MSANPLTVILLWIDFKLYFYVRIHKLGRSLRLGHHVVNWFQIVFLREDSQGRTYQYTCKFCCELISNCIFTWGFTRRLIDAVNLLKLWIDFKLYFYVRIHKDIKIKTDIIHVVNWFQIVFLREDSQVDMIYGQLIASCELISNCIFTWGFTRGRSILVDKNALWIDFKLYFYVRIHKSKFKHKRSSIVVNWFQIVFLREDSQVHGLDR